MEIATRSSSTATNFHCDIEQELKTSAVVAASLRNSQSIEMDCDVSSDSNTNAKGKNLFGAAQQVLKVCRRRNQNLEKALPQFLFRSKPTLENYKSSLRNIESCEYVINKKAEVKFSSIDMALLNITITTSYTVVKNHTFVIWNTQHKKKKHLALLRDTGVVLQPFVHYNTPKHSLHSKFCKNVFAKIRSHVHSSTSYNFFRNKQHASGKHFSFVGMVQFFKDKTATTLKTNAIVAYLVLVVLLNFTQKFRSFFVFHGHTFVVLLPVCTTKYEQDEQQEKYKIHTKWEALSSHHMMHCL